MLRLLQFLGFLIVAIYSSNLYLYYFMKGITGFKPLYWYVMTIGLALSLILVTQGLTKVPRHILIWLWVFLCYSLFNFLYSSQSAEVQQVLIQNIQSTALLFSFIVIIQQSGTRNVRLVLLTILFFAVLINFFDFISPTWSKVPGRAAGLYTNPNASGKVLLFLMVASIPLVPLRYRLLFCLFVGFGILVTFSRSTWVLWVIALMGLAGSGDIVLKNKGISFVLMGLLSGAIVYSLLTGGLYSLLADSGAAQYLKPQTIARLGGDRSALAGDASIVSRAEVAKLAWNVFQEYPWLGAGLGYTREWGHILPHNMYLMMAAEGGVLGLAVFVALIIALWHNTDSVGKIIIVLFALKSMSSHNMLDQPTMLILLALIAVSFNLKGSNSEYKKEVSNGVVS